MSREPIVSARQRQQAAARQGRVATGKLPVEKPIELAELTTRQRKSLKKSQFALPPDGYPIPDESHARNALARVSQFGTPAEKAKVRAAVKRKFPNIKMGK